MMILVYMYWCTCIGVHVLYMYCIRLKITYFIFKILFYWRHLKNLYSEDQYFKFCFYMEQPE